MGGSKETAASRISNGNTFMSSMRNTGAHLAEIPKENEACHPERLFSGLIGHEYQMLDLVCPAIADMSRRVGELASSHPCPKGSGGLAVLEIGCGSGRTTRELSKARPDSFIAAVDNEPAMLTQAHSNLAPFLDEGRVRLIEKDALSALAELAGDSQDIVASAYTLHNFLGPYRSRVLAEIFRVLRRGGIFINGDRYGLDDTLVHTRLIQEEVCGYIKTFASIGRIDLLEQWITHLFSDESPDHIMRLGPSVEEMQAIGFAPVEVRYRDGINALLVAMKPSR